LPKMNCLNLLIFLTAANILHLLIHFYSSTLTRIIYHFDLEKTFLISLYFFDSNPFVCKLVAYLKFVTRFFALSSILVFSFERLLAIYYPLKTFKKFKNYLLFFLIVLSIIFPVYVLFFVDIVQLKGDYKSYISDKNNAKNFQIATLTPIFQETYCSVSMNYEKLFFKYHFASYAYILLSNILISISSIIIVIKMKRRTGSFTSLRINKKRNSNISIPNLSSSYREQTSVFLSVANKKTTKVSRNTDQDTRKISSMSISVHEKFQNTKMLITLSISFIIFNFPYFFVLFIVYLNYDSFIVQSKDDLLKRIQLKSYFTIMEIFQLFNVSITGLLLYMSGKTFRIHLKSWINRSASRI